MIMLVEEILGVRHENDLLLRLGLSVIFFFVLVETLLHKIKKIYMRMKCLWILS